MAERTGLEGLRILIAEDNLFAALELEQTLLAFGCQPVGPVARVDQAMSLALHEDLDGALLNIELQVERVRIAELRVGEVAIPLAVAP
jgi:hypothetical protein